MSGAPSTSTKARRSMRRPCRISSALQWRSISRARTSRSPGERAASGPTSFIAGSGHISSHRGRASAPASFAKQFGVEAPEVPDRSPKHRSVYASIWLVCRRAVEVIVCADKLTHYRDFIAFASRDSHSSAGQIRPRGLIVPVYSHRERNGRPECQGTGGDVRHGGPDHDGHRLRIIGRGGEAGVGGESQEDLQEGEREQQRGGAAERGVLHVVHQHLKASPHRESSGDYGTGDVRDCRHRAVANCGAQDSLKEEGGLRRRGLFGRESWQRLSGGGGASPKDERA